MISGNRIIQAAYDATWGRFVFAGAYDRFLQRAEKAGLSEHRRKLLAQARGRTLEIATGTGLNFPHYPTTVSELVLTEPYQHMVSLLRAKVARSTRSVTVMKASAEKLPFPDASFDTVVGTMILCTAPDPALVLHETARVLKPGGQFLFLEHVRNSNPRIARWQDRAQPFWYLFGNGCHCNRDSIATLRSSPLLVEELHEGRIPHAWSIIELIITGRARRFGDTGNDECVDNACRTDEPERQSAESGKEQIGSLPQH